MNMELLQEMDRIDPLPVSLSEDRNYRRMKSAKDF
jgi:hypothetical protein